MITITPAVRLLRQQLLSHLLFDNKPRPELFAILAVYFAQGILRLTQLATSFFLKDELGLTPAQSSALLGVIVLPWMGKLLWGFLSDSFPIFGYRRRSYLFLSGLIGTGSLIALGTVIETTWATVTALLLQSLAIAVSDVIADSLVAERARHETVDQVGSLQSLCWAASAVGGILSAYLGGFLLQKLGIRPVFLIASIFPVMILLVTGLVNEAKAEQRSPWLKVRQQVGLLKQAMAHRQIWMPAVFILIWQATPNSSSALFFFTTNELGFEPEFLGRVQFLTGIAGLIGVWLFQRFFKSVPFRKIFGWTIIISTLLGLTSLLLVTHTNRALGIDDHWFALGDGLILETAGKIAQMPFFVLAARLCPIGVEATLFALLMSLYNFGGIASTELGAWLTNSLGVTQTDFTNLWLLILLTNLSSLIPLPLLKLLPDATSQSKPVELSIVPETPHLQTPHVDQFLIGSSTIQDTH